ncbi:MAG TPA: type I-F CRISPR-associated endoribonuclease Cas6/Csy4 [Rhodoferax sp.]|nr:type I-F CRISPR-associated endoribonuclease Cas6/Csy4 [Rhodoferax sp.]
MLQYTQIDLLSRAEETSPKPILLARLMRILHGVFQSKPETFAIALPSHGFSSVRVFARDRTELDFLAGAIQSHWFVRDYTRLGYPAAVPADYAGAWVSYRRYRIPSAKSDRNAQARQPTLGQRRSAQAQKDGLVYLISDSQSNQQKFSLFVQSMAAAGPGEFRPNSYGLSSSKRAFALPDVP